MSALPAWCAWCTFRSRRAHRMLGVLTACFRAAGQCTLLSRQIRGVRSCGGCEYHNAAKACSPHASATWQISIQWNGRRGKNKGCKLGSPLHVMWGVDLSRSLPTPHHLEHQICSSTPLRRTQG